MKETLEKQNRTLGDWIEHPSEPTGTMSDEDLNKLLRGVFEDSGEQADMSIPFNLQRFVELSFEDGKTEGEIADILKEWIKDGTLRFRNKETGEYVTPKCPK